RAIETSFVIRGSSSATRTRGWVPTHHLRGSTQRTGRGAAWPDRGSGRRARVCLGRGRGLDRRDRVVSAVVRRGVVVRRRGAGVAWSEEEEPDGDDQDDDGDDPEDHAHAVVVAAADDDSVMLVSHGLEPPTWLGVRVPPIRR